MRMKSIRFALPLAFAVIGVLNTAGIDGQATGAFQEPLAPKDFGPAADVTIDNGAFPVFFEWGTVPSSGGNQSRLNYWDSDPFSLSGAGDSFSVGELDYFNGQSDAGTGVEFIDLKLSLDFGGGNVQDFTFTLNVENTGNDDPTYDQAPANADIVRFLNPTASTMLDLGAAGSFYLTVGFELLPNQGDGFLSENDTALNVVESGGASASIVASLSTTNPNAAVPDAPSTLALLGTAFASLSLWRRLVRR